MDGAMIIIDETRDKAASYHFAQRREAAGELRDAIGFYAFSGCYNHAIRLARLAHLDSEVMRYSIMATPAIMLDCAQHFEMKCEFDKAVQLYHKAGDLPRALDLCFRAGNELADDPGRKTQSAAMFEMINTIAADLGATSSPQTLARCAEFLVQNKQFPRAVELYVLAKKYVQAIEMCLQHKVVISEELTEKLTPPESEMDAPNRKEALKNLGKVLRDQGSFVLAARKYTQAGDKVRAMKCLVLSGDTKQVIQFANISRTAEIYKLAANYLQQQNWRESADIMKSIIIFYTKAQAYEQLAGFYDSCAQVACIHC
jgi:intraflagellar transport protein 140